MLLRGARATFLAVSALGLSACGGLQWPPPPQLTPNSVAKPAGQAPVTAAAAQRSVTVQDGETLYDVAKRTGSSPRAIIDANNLQPPYRMSKGQSLVVPAPRSHTVVRGDTLNALSRQYGVDVYEVARLNNLQPPYNIRVGQALTLPGGDARPGVEVADRSNATVPPITPAVRSGAVQVEEMKPVAVASVPAPVKEIASAPVPPSAQSTAPAPQAMPTYVSSAATVAAPASESEALPEVAAALATIPIERPAAAAAEPAQEKAQLASLPRSNAKPRPGGKFIWPVDGKLMSEYGSKGDGLHNDGINVAAPKGAPVYAAANGTVAYAGNEIRGFGNLLLIQHADGWMTAYAHNDKLLVRKGDKVSQGQPISTVGASGNVASPQLHFEIRRGKRAVDPLDQLGTQSAKS